MLAGASLSGEEAARSGRGANMHGMVSSSVETGGQAGDWRLKTREGGRYPCTALVSYALHCTALSSFVVHCSRNHVPQPVAMQPSTHHRLHRLITQTASLCGLFFGPCD